MAKYRSLHVKLWTDPEFEGFPVSAKIIFLYLLTNANRTESGIYDISQAMIAFQCGLTRDDVTTGIGILADAGKVHYDAASSTVWIVNAVKHQALNGNCIKSIATDLRRCTNRAIVTAFCEYYLEFGPIAAICREILGHPSTSDSLTDTEPIPNPSQTHCEGVGDPPYRVQGTGYGVQGTHAHSSESSEREDAHTRESTVTRPIGFSDPSVYGIRTPDGSVILNSATIVDAALPGFHVPLEIRPAIVAWVETHDNKLPGQHDCHAIRRRCDDYGIDMVTLAIRKMGNAGKKSIDSLDAILMPLAAKRRKEAAAQSPRGDA